MAEAKIPGGAYLVGGVWKNAHGDELTDEQIAALEGQDTSKKEAVNLTKLNKDQLVKLATERGVSVDADATKAEIIAALEGQDTSKNEA
jgi:hypothetical protein